MLSIEPVSDEMTNHYDEGNENSLNKSKKKIPPGSIKNTDVNFPVKMSFYVTYAFLLTTATLTFIEAMRTKIPMVRHILNLETTISIVAAFFYTQFMLKINKPHVNFKDINLNRYADWAITTPIMLLVLCISLGYNIKTVAKFSTFLKVLFFNYGMLLSGYLGETGKTDKMTGTFIGFGFFFLLYLTVYNNFIKGKKSFDNRLIYWSFVVLWSLYGVSYWLDEQSKNVAFNILDLFAKCFVGIFFWAYFTKPINLFK